MFSFIDEPIIRSIQAVFKRVFYTSFKCLTHTALPPSCKVLVLFVTPASCGFVVWFLLIQLQSHTTKEHEHKTNPHEDAQVEMSLVGYYLRESYPNHSVLVTLDNDRG